MGSRDRQITGLEPDPLRPGAVRVQVDGKPWGALDREDARRVGLAVGQRLEGEQDQLASAAADVESAFRTVLRALGRRPHATAELRRRLIRRGHPPTSVEQALARATAAGLLDDEAFARRFVETRAARGRGPGRLRRDLASLGVAAAAVDRALQQSWPEESDPESLAAELARKRVAQLGDLPRDVKLRRVVAFLGRRGFTGSRVTEMVRRLLRT